MAVELLRLLLLLLFSRRGEEGADELEEEREKRAEREAVAVAEKDCFAVVFCRDGEDEDGAKPERPAAAEDRDRGDCGVNDSMLSISS